jgi:hypothetical protein
VNPALVPPAVPLAVSEAAGCSPLQTNEGDFTMTNETTTTTANKPVAYLYYAKTRRGAKDRLVRIGAVFAHKSGNGRTHILDALPLNQQWDGRLVELEPNDDADAATEAAA